MSQEFYYIGQIALFPNNQVPEGWLLCNGQQLSVQQNTALFELIGAKFGGNGTTAFNLPNLQGAEPQPGMQYYINKSGSFPG
jgi:microcystin-dependent protein